MRLREIPVALKAEGGAGTAAGVGVGGVVGVAVAGTGVAVGGKGVEVLVGVRVAVGGGAEPLRIVNESSTAPVSRRNFASRRLWSTSRTIEPSWFNEMNIAGWFKAPPLVWPELPATA